MPDIDPAALSRNDSVSGPSPVTVTPSKPTGAPSAAPKPGKSINTAQRIDLEPLYTALKIAVGEHWADYKEAISLFVLGTSCAVYPWVSYCLDFFGGTMG